MVLDIRVVQLRGENFHYKKMKLLGSLILQLPLVLDWCDWPSVFHLTDGFLKARLWPFLLQRFNVSITRAKALLIVVGNPHILCRDVHWNK